MLVMFCLPGADPCFLAAMSSQTSFGTNMLCKFPQTPDLSCQLTVLFAHMGVISFVNCLWYACGLCSVQSINDDLNASLAAADELSREFNDMLKEASSNNNNTMSGPQVCAHMQTSSHTQIMSTGFSS